MDESRFDDIRPYRDEEYNKIKQQLAKMPILKDLAHYVFPGVPHEKIVGKLLESNSIADFQEKISYPVVVQLIGSTCSDYSFSGLDNLDQDKPYMFITNHRDIVFDQIVFARTLYENNFNTAEVAIGDNLISEEWIKDLMRINKSFIVKRNLPARALVLESRKLSEYIYYNLKERKHSVWIAQREGRAKDNNDRTQQGLLNMLGLTSKDNIRDHFLNLNIVVVSMSYEDDPCDADKVKAIYAERTHGKYVKTPGEDEQTMRKGLLGQKGHVHIHFSKPLNDEIQQIDQNIHKNQFYGLLKNIIDRNVVEGYKLWKNNYIAYDIYTDSGRYSHKYTDADKNNYIALAEDKIKNLEGDKNTLRSIFFEINARPILNQEAFEQNQVKQD